MYVFLYLFINYSSKDAILTDAAIKGKTDILHGLKENVITGKLIPAGRGLLSDEQEDELLETFDVKSGFVEVAENTVSICVEQ